MPSLPTKEQLKETFAKRKDSEEKTKASAEDHKSKGPALPDASEFCLL